MYIAKIIDSQIITPPLQVCGGFTAEQAAEVNGFTPGTWRIITDEEAAILQRGVDVVVKEVLDTLNSRRDYHMYKPVNFTFKAGSVMVKGDQTAEDMILPFPADPQTRSDLKNVVKSTLDEVVAMGGIEAYQSKYPVNPLVVDADGVFYYPWVVDIKTTIRFTADMPEPIFQHIQGVDAEVMRMWQAFGWNIDDIVTAVDDEGNPMPDEGKISRLEELKQEIENDELWPE